MNLLDLAVKISIDDQVSNKIGGVADNVKSKLSGMAKAGATAVVGSVAAAGAAAGALGKAALDSYASYEQLEGGIEKLFGTGGQSLEEYAQRMGVSVDQARGKYNELNAASDLVMKNAQQAYKTTGMSANEYAEQVSGISAALVNSLGGDTVAAAERADVAMRAISDNVNTFGTDAQSVSYAFQGFAKQNYTMLDNLKLGYGGTKSEMERLIKDANEWGAANGKASNLSIDSFADVVTAIDQIQQKNQIAGTTAREAAHTIEGSINSTKGAWQNLLTELGKEDGDVGARMTELLTSVFGDGTENNPGVLGNVLPRVQQIFQSIVDAIPTMVPIIAEALSQSAPMILETITSLASAIVGIVQQLAPQLATALPALIQQLIPVFVELAPTILGAAVQMFLGIVQALAEAGPQIMDGLFQVLSSLIQIMIDNLPAFLDAAGKLFLAFIEALATHGPEIGAKLIELLGVLIQYVADHWQDMLTAAGKLLAAIVEAIDGAVDAGLRAIGDLIGKLVSHIGDFVNDMVQAGLDLIGGFIEGIGRSAKGVIDAVGGAVGGAVDSVKSFLGIASPSKLFKEFGDFTMEGFAEGIERTASDAEEAMRKAASNVYGAASGTIDVNGKYGMSAINAAPPVAIYIGEFVNNTDTDVRTLSMRLGELTAAEMKARGYA